MAIVYTRAVVQERERHMKRTFSTKISAILLGLAAALLPAGMANAAESTMPDTFKEVINPAVAGKYTYTENGAYTKALGIPTYEWMPTNPPLKAIVIGIHGLTLHGRRYRVLARALAVNGIGFVAMDMRGFGSSLFEDKFSTPDNDRKKVSHEKSYEEIVQLTKLIKEKYPDTRLIALGESLGCTFCVKLAAEHPDLLTGIVLAAPAVKVNKDMYGGEGQIRQGIKAVIRPSHELNMSSFFADLCSQRADVQQEMLIDPYIVKKLPLGALISTDEFVDKTAKWGKTTDPSLAVLLLQGSADGCVSPKHITDLMNNMKSDDQTLAWRGNFGHLQLETVYMQPAVIDAIANWMVDHSKDRQAKLKDLQQNIADLGGTIVK
jgi:alpha-beta hydrolase superfamily lysophospholipase